MFWKHSHHDTKTISKGVEFRILPLGDSFTWGEGSSDGNGYRQALANLISQNGNNLTYIGSVKSGSMSNNENEGHGGNQILAVGEKGKSIYPERPNIVLLMAGANDVVFKNDVFHAPQRLSAVIADIVFACPDAVILVGTLLPLLNPQTTDAVIGFNSMIMGVIWEFANKGKKVDLVDMGRVTTHYINTRDGIHPIDEGYQLIAAAWYDGLVRAAKKGWIQQPVTRPSDYQANETSDQDRKPIDHYVGIKIEKPELESTLRLKKPMLYLLFLLGLVLFGRKAIVFLIHRYRQ